MVKGALCEGLGDRVAAHLAAMPMPLMDEAVGMG